jgi:hypothetical protein
MSTVKPMAHAAGEYTTIPLRKALTTALAEPEGKSH